MGNISASTVASQRAIHYGYSKIKECNNSIRIVTAHGTEEELQLHGNNMRFFLHKICLKNNHKHLLQFKKILRHEIGNMNARPMDWLSNIIYTIICLKSVDVRRLQVAILARSPREMSQTDRILPRYFLSRVRVSVRPRIFLYAKKLPNHSRPDH